MTYHFHPVRYLIMAAMGLGALYMIHLLAQDYNRIRKPVAAIAKALFTKRDVDSVLKQEKLKVSI